MSLGSVSLVGAGPGDPELLTIKAFRTIQSADVIFYDSLLAEHFKDIFPKGIPHFHVGKRCDNHLVPQREIEKQLIRWAKSGNHVVRLKGGDPFIFGRGGEEVQALVEDGIPFQIIPGLSSLNGIAGKIGLPLTHRGLVRKIMIVEGHTLGSEENDYNSLVNFDGTIAIFMAAKKISDIAQNLLAAGADPSKKLILIESDASMHQHWQIHSLKAAAKNLCQKKTTGPGIIYISETIEIFEEWQANKAVIERKVSNEQASAFIF